MGFVGEGCHGVGDALGHVVESEAELCFVTVVVADQIDAVAAGDVVGGLIVTY